ncbi:rhodanese-like domain-containing protein [Arenimonas sp.]|uniref:rhodanese-like domain-containing protein n=1 Tax=Arenimonas sp. TaxID=1872635 RepID=UPI0039E59FEA
MFVRLALLFAWMTSTCLAAGTSMSPAELAALIESHKAPLVLDVRSDEEFAQGHIPGAVLIPHDQLETRIGELGEPREVVVYCRSGRRSGLIQPVLEKNGFKVRQLEGSWQAWQAAKLPEELPEKEPAPEKSPAASSAKP